MATMFPGHVSASQVGSYFVGQYYRILQQQPELVYQFYNDASTVIRVDGDVEETAAGMMQIHSLVTTSNFAGIEIKTAHSLDSWNEGVLVMVSGFVQANDSNARRNFVQTFFLAPQEKGYYVLNDIFHLLDEEPLHQHPATILAQNPYENDLMASNPITEQVSEYILGQEIQDRNYVAPVLAEENNMVNYSIPEPQQHIPEYDERVGENPPEESIASFSDTVNMAREPSSVTKEEVTGEQPKKTYASILRLSKAQPAVHVPQPASLSKTSNVTSDRSQAPQAALQQSFSALSVGADKSNSEAAGNISAVENGGEEKSVYVGNVPNTITETDLELEFKNFGRIKPDGVAIRSRKESGGYYAFVEFEEVVGVKNALKASPIVINGWQIYVEERRSSGGLPRAGRRGRGRGGHPSESSRGRSGRGSGRSGGQDNYERDYNNRTRANGVPQRAPRQDKGILGNHAARRAEATS